MKSKTEAAAAHGSSAAGDEAKLLSNTIPTLPLLAVKDLLSIGERDHVLKLFAGECMSCKHCTSGKSNICHVLGLKRWGVMQSDQGTSFSVKGRPIFHYCVVSSFSEYTVVHSGCAVKVSSVAPLEKICLFSCGVAASLGAAWKVTDTDGGSPVSEKAKVFGITNFINPHDYDEPIQQVRPPLKMSTWVEMCRPAGLKSNGYLLVDEWLRVLKLLFLFFCNIYSSLLDLQYLNCSRNVGKYVSYYALASRLYIIFLLCLASYHKAKCLIDKLLECL
ncbi:hypothetical protein HYC85_013999 [Camellia sinensis]|uniref:Uncharacterized protein n=1 Tax=Camellia sinensis TaxID=4442 RepID=A0A7J7H4Z8_CAMSI|nr:hypothetical protein HYC85_013999 [Camellia sinensis]